MYCKSNEKYYVSKESKVQPFKIKSKVDHLKFLSAELFKQQRVKSMIKICR